MTQRLVTVVTVCYQAAIELEKTLQSVLNQDFKNFEYVIKDGGSTDGTEQLVGLYMPRFKEKGIPCRYISERDSGIYEAMNQAVQLSAGVWIQFMNAGDSFFDSSVLSDIFLEKIPDEVQVIYGNAAEQDMNEQLLWKGDMSCVREKCPFNHQSCFARKTWLTAHPFRTDLKIASDYDFILRSYLAGADFLYRDRIIAVFVRDGISSRKVKKSFLEAWQVRKECNIVKRHDVSYWKFWCVYTVKQLLFSYAPPKVGLWFRNKRRKAENKYIELEQGDTKERSIVLLSKGDADNPETFSNIPYYLKRTLERKGFRIYKVSIEEKPGLFANLYTLFWRIIRRNRTTYAYCRSGFRHSGADRIMRKAVETYPHADMFISTTFTYSPSRFTSKKCILFGDWTYEYWIHYFLKRQEDFLERREIIREDSTVESADCVISLFPAAARHMCAYYQNPNIYYLGNVINTEEQIDPDTDFSEKNESGIILFIGRKKYRRGAVCAANALRRLKCRDIKLHIIGMTEDEFAGYEDVSVCYGFLDKSIPAQRDRYYELLKKARVCVNTTEGWGGPSSIIEAMYNGTPVITSAYQEFTEMFGEHISFGYYCRPEDEEDLAQYLSKFLTMDQAAYSGMCREANTAVQEFTWDAYVDKMLEAAAKSKRGGCGNGVG